MIGQEATLYAGPACGATELARAIALARRCRATPRTTSITRSCTSGARLLELGRCVRDARHTFGFGPRPPRVTA